MTTQAIFFMLASWGGVLGLTVWAFARLLRSKPAELPPAGENSPETMNGR